ncbi:MAG TPA: hypothetical protein VN089_21110, partial [Duganella sp.]|nr:hypothetical protein [Duganella sp.]
LVEGGRAAGIDAAAALRAMIPATTRTAGASRQMANVLAIAIGASAYASVYPRPPSTRVRPPRRRRV